MQATVDWEYSPVFLTFNKSCHQKARRTNSDHVGNVLRRRLNGRHEAVPDLAVAVGVADVADVEHHVRAIAHVPRHVPRCASCPAGDV